MRSAVKMTLVKQEKEEDACDPEPRGTNNEKQAGMLKVKEEIQDLNEVEEKHNHQNFPNALKDEKSSACSQTEDGFSQSSTQMSEVNEHPCGNSSTHDINLSEETTNDDPTENHTQMNRFTCNQCGKGYPLKGRLNQHMQIHTKNVFTCTQCGKSFIYKTQLENHMRVHTKEKPYTCHRCGETFTWGNSLKYHLLRHHSEVLEYKCDHCSKTFDKVSHLKSHLNTHTKQKYCDCSACEKSSCHERRSAASQKGKDTFTCPQCGLFYTCKRRLDKHMKSHSEQTCAVCGRLFAKKATLKIHMRVHTGEKPYTCPQCGKGFSHKGNFRKHISNYHQEVQADSPEQMV